MKDFFKTMVKGIFVGVANIIPGVSGGTIAVVLRIFDRLIDAINNFLKEPKKHIMFLIPLLIGALVGIGAFSKLIKFSLENFSLPTNLFFVGLVVGSIPLIYKNASSKGVKPVNYVAAVIAFIIVAGISFIGGNEVSTKTVLCEIASADPYSDEIKNLCYEDNAKEYGISQDKLKDGYAYGDTVVVTAKSSKNVKEIEESLKKYSVKSKNKIIKSAGKFVLLYMGDEPEKAIDLFKKGTGNNIKITPLSLVGICVGGIVASSAMVIPGISGSFVMVLIGLYNTVLTSISDFISITKDSIMGIGKLGFANAFMNIAGADCFKILVAVGIGVIIGIIVISKIISVLLDKAFTMTYFVILGLIFGSLFSIFADSATYATGTDVIGIISGICVCGIGFFISIKLGE